MTKVLAEMLESCLAENRVHEAPVMVRQWDFDCTELKYSLANIGI